MAIPTIRSYACKAHCGCNPEYVPLTIAFGKTVHSFQGQNVGLTEPNQPENIVKHIIVHPGPRSFEGNNPGLLYTIISRATTLGIPEEKMSSAIYFDGINSRPEHFQNITLNAKREPYKKVQIRKSWVNYLNKGEYKQQQQKENFNEEWIESRKMSKEDAHDLLDQLIVTNE